MQHQTQKCHHVPMCRSHNSGLVDALSRRCCRAFALELALCLPLARLHMHEYHGMLPHEGPLHAGAQPVSQRASDFCELCLCLQQCFASTPSAPAPCAMPSSGRMGLHTQPPCSPRKAHAGLGSAGLIMRSLSSCLDCCAMLGLCSLLLLVAHRRMRHGIEPHWLPVSCHEANL